ncbi:MAG: apolipoprotein N-acyltransferase [Acidimicrobiales bacterium]|jgi:apolipoprotein N-acyltransferase
MRSAAARLHLVAALVGGALVGLSLPPIGWWPMAIVGIAAIAWALGGRRLRGRLGLGMLAGIGQFSISLAWAIQFNIAGYIALSIVEAAFVAVACVLVPPGRGRLPALAGAMILAEFARQHWPFGGLPLGGLPLGQMDGPIGLVARVGGPLLVVGVTVLAGAAIAAVLPRPAAPAGSATADTAAFRQRWPAAALGIAVAVAVTLVAALAPNGTGSGTPPAGAPTGSDGEIRVAIVQGGGRRGLDQLQVPASVVLAAAVRATAQVPRGVQLILWPEDVVGLTVPFVGSSAYGQLSDIARAHDATLVAGVTYPVGATLFRNEIVAFSPSGRLVATFEKVHRVPFGEYVPERGFFKHLANLKDIPRDAIAGHGSGMISTPVGQAAVLVSYEVFFADRGRSGVRAGGKIIFVPTNTSSYSSEQAPAQEIAASRLQAIEEGRYVLQAAPTGYSAVIDNDGHVEARTPLSSEQVITTSVPLLNGSTWYERFGDEPVLLAALAMLALGWALDLSRRGRPRRHRRRSPSS